MNIGISISFSLPNMTFVVIVLMWYRGLADCNERRQIPFGIPRRNCCNRLLAKLQQRTSSRSGSCYVIVELERRWKTNSWVIEPALTSRLASARDVILLHLSSSTEIPRVALKWSSWLFLILFNVFDVEILFIRSVIFSFDHSPVINECISLQK